MASIACLPSDVIVHIMVYLRAADLGALSSVNKTVFSQERISASIAEIIGASMPTAALPAFRKQLSIAATVHFPNSLFVVEVLSVLNAIAQPQPPSGKGFWVSSAWVASAKRHLESLALPDLLQKRSVPIKRKAKPKNRYSSDNLPLSAVINLDILCKHGQLKVDSRRRAIDGRAWTTLRRYYPAGPEFRCLDSTECAHCAQSVANSLQDETRRRESILLQRQEMAPLALQNLLERKHGVPENSLLRRWAFADEEAELPIEAIQAMLGEYVHPLKPGLYNAVPRDWLRMWRRYVRDLSVNSLPALDCSRLLCYSHGLLVVPPHLEEYLLGMRKALLGGLGMYEGEVVELVTAEEWDELQRVNRGLTDFGVRCSIDSESITWNTPICIKCDPFSYATYVNSCKELVGKSSLPRNRQTALKIS